MKLDRCDRDIVACGNSHAQHVVRARLANVFVTSNSDFRRGIWPDNNVARSLGPAGDPMLVN